MEGILEGADDVEIGHAGLDHQHVGALGDVERGLADRLAAVGGVHLVGLLVGTSQGRGRADGGAERAVEGRGELGRVGEDQGVVVPGAVERLAHGPDAAVHHVGGGDDVAARLGLAERLAAKRLERLVVEDHAVPDQPVLAVAGVGIEGDIGDQAELREPALEEPERAADEVLRVPGLAAVLGLGVRRGHRKERHGRDAGLEHPLGRAQDAIRAVAHDPRHGADALLVIAAIHDEDRQDEIGGAHTVLGDQPPAPVGAAQAARARMREGRQRRQMAGLAQGKRPLVVALGCSCLKRQTGKGRRPARQASPRAPGDSAASPTRIEQRPLAAVAAAMGPPDRWGVAGPRRQRLLLRPPRRALHLGCAQRLVQGIRQIMEPTIARRRRSS